MIKSTTLNFLKELKNNNNREWFHAHKDEHDAARIDLLNFVTSLIPRMAEFDKALPVTLQAKDCLMRIYRDIRFSKDKTPFKVNFGIAISPNGKNFEGCGYYLHIEPGKSFVAGGSWMPVPDHLKLIRQEIDYNAADLHDILNKPSFTKTFGTLNTDDKLKTSPKGYPTDHPDIEILKLKSFTVECPISDKVLTSKDAVETITAIFAELFPFILFLRNAIHS